MGTLQRLADHDGRSDTQRSCKAPDGAPFNLDLVFVQFLPFTDAMHRNRIHLALQVLMDILNAVHSAAFEHVHHVAFGRMQSELQGEHAAHLKAILAATQKYTAQIQTACFRDKQQQTLRQAIEDMATIALQLHTELRAKPFDAVNKLQSRTQQCAAKMKAELDKLAAEQDGVAKSVLVRCDFGNVLG